MEINLDGIKKVLTLMQIGAAVLLFISLQVKGSLVTFILLFLLVGLSICCITIDLIKFKTSDILNGNGQTTKVQNGINYYLIELFDDERTEIIKIVTCTKKWSYNRAKEHNYEVII